MRRRATILLVVLAAACSEAVPTDPDTRNAEGIPGLAVQAQTRIVTNAADAGPGSFRDAVAEASANPSIGRIRFSPGIGTVALQATVTYGGTQNLLIDGRGAVLDASGAGTDGFAATGGGDLALLDITIQNAPQDGVWVSVPAGATGQMTVQLDGVTIQGNGRYGLHVDDRAGGEAGGFDSAAGIVLDVRFSHILNNNADLTPGVFDFDGIRVDEGGDGAIEARVLHSEFTGNRADGLELDEAGDGHAALFVRRSTFDGNGDQVQVEDDPEDGFDVDEAGPGDLHLDVAETSSMNNADDGIDLDEDGQGTIVARIVQVDVSGSGNDGLVFTEDEFNQVGAGGIRAVIIEATATGMGDRGLDADEWGAGDIDVQVTGSHFDDNDSDGVRFEEEGDGDVSFVAKNSSIDGNGDEGLQIEELGAGSVSLTLQNSSLDRNEDNGAQLEELGNGDLSGRFQNSSASGNQDWGVIAEQEAPGTGTLELLGTDVLDNGNGPFDLAGVVVL